MKIADFVRELKTRPDFVHHEIIKPSDAAFKDIPLSTEIKKALESSGIERLYRHQALGIELVRGGVNTVVMTPTASGKSIVYNIPVVESALKDPCARALYLFPLKGLEQDQLKHLRDLAAGLKMENLCEIYDGDTPEKKRAAIRGSPPAVGVTNPHKLHFALCGYHEKWESFFRNLKFVIIDEIHTYRGVLGSHVAHVVRRLRRIASRYGSTPVFIASSATISNPKELAEMLTGLPFTLISESAAPRGKRNFIFLNPADVSPYTAATRLFIESVRRGFKTIAFTKARKITELLHRWLMESSPDVRGLVSSYRAGFLPAERREIESRLFSGALRGVISTSALELGVDVGGLDVCILVGYPGTVAATWQRSGRVGRKGEESLVTLIAVEDALDQYFMRSPGDFFRRNVEAATIDALNPAILKEHLLCAAAELPVKHGEEVYGGPAVEPALTELEREKKLWRGGRPLEPVWGAKTGFPHRNVSIRGIGTPYRIISEEGKPIGESTHSRVFRELHPGAIYLHMGSQFMVERLDLKARKIFCKAVDVNYYTTPITSEHTEIVSVEERKKSGLFELNRGVLKTTEQTLGFRIKDIHTRKTVREAALKLPTEIFTTKGVWFRVEENLIERGFDAAGGLHALEHSLIATLPLFSLCDRFDLGGVSYTHNPQLEAPAVFVYDGYEGGVGLTKRGFDVSQDWFLSTLRLMEDCNCEKSCPSCTQDPKCGNNNEPLDKRGAIGVLRRGLG